MGTGSFPGVDCGRSVALTNPPLLAPMLKKEESYTSNPHLVFVVCPRVTFTFTFISLKYTTIALNPVGILPFSCRELKYRVEYKDLPRFEEA
jgi:hypothetical protein